MKGQDNRVILGNLAGIINVCSGKKLSGYGLYARGVYFSAYRRWTWPWLKAMIIQYANLTFKRKGDIKTCL